MFDLVLKGGEVFDGTGADSFTGDVGIKNGFISEVSRKSLDQADEVIDVSGLTVSPGFIDMHTHSDFTLIADGRAESQVIPMVSPWYTSEAEHSHWHGFAEYLDALAGSELGVNVMAFVGHGTVHRAVMGTELRAGEPDEIAEMAKLVDQCMDEGAGGFSSGLEYFPGILAAPEHLVPMCEVAAKRNRLYATHVRNRDTQYDLGFTEAIATARQAGARLQISRTMQI